MKKRISAAAIALSAVMAFSSCGRSNPEAAEITETVSQETTVSSAETAESGTVSETTAVPVTKPAEPLSEPAVTIITEGKSAYDLPDGFYEELAEITEKYDHFLYYDISMAYYDIETGFTLMLNPDSHYFAASVMKAPYMLYIYRLALAGEADLEEKLLYTEEYKREGTGVLKDSEPDTEYTVEELIGFCLESSDNSAFAMLRKRFPEKGYVEFIRSLGIDHEDDAKAFNHPQICCETSLKYSRAIYDFIEEGNPCSENLRYHMTHSRNAMIYGSEGAEVVRKYGWHGGFFHDMAVVYGEKTYLLTIMTNLDLLEIDSREYNIFRDLSKLVAKYSGMLSETGGDGDMMIIKIPKTEENKMNLPKDPYMLLSVLNMKLRDSYKDFDALCDDMDADPAAITAAMEKLGYAYDKAVNRFTPIPEETSQS